MVSTQFEIADTRSNWCSAALPERSRRVCNAPEVRIFGTSVDTADRTTAVAGLRHSVVDGTLASADIVYSRLGELAGSYAMRGARVTVGMLRRMLITYPLKRHGFCPPFDAAGGAQLEAAKSDRPNGRPPVFPAAARRQRQSSVRRSGQASTISTNYRMRRGGCPPRRHGRPLSTASATAGTRCCCTS